MKTINESYEKQYSELLTGAKSKIINNGDFIQYIFDKYDTFLISTPNKNRVGILDTYEISLETSIN